MGNHRTFTDTLFQYQGQGHLLQYSAHHNSICAECTFQWNDANGDGESLPPVLGG